MFFNSIDFALFFPVVFILYWLVAKKLKIRNLLILVASYVFYGWWDERFLILIVISSAVDYFIGLKLGRTNNKVVRKWLLGASLFVNLGFLFYFKYANFFIESFVNSFRLFGSEIEISTLHIILPVGISFYTFQTLSYTIDVYRGKIKPTKDILAFFSFVAFFPQLVAGPIERASHLLPQFHKTYTFNYNQIKSGLLLMAFGLFKKMVIADRAALYVNEVYSDVDSFGSVTYIYGTILFAFQIYCDFSGYSDIAIGVSRTMGFDLMKNFNLPYFATSLTDFWRRWHISLSTWFRDYVYIPLGGSRKGKLRTYINLFAVFVISGLWHGAAWTFVIWGAIHGFVLMVEKGIQEFKIPVLPRGIISGHNFAVRWFFQLVIFAIVCLAWIFFRANSLTDAWTVLSGIFTKFNWRDLLNQETYLVGFKAYEFRVVVISILVLIGVEIYHRKYNLVRTVQNLNIVLRWIFYLIIVFAIILFGMYGENTTQEFIYFQF